MMEIFGGWGCQNLNDGNVILRTIPFSMARAAQTAPVREL